VSDLSKRFVGERSVNWTAMIFVVLVLGSCFGGLAWLYKRQIGRRTEALRAQIERAERGETNDDLDELYSTILRFAPRDAEALARYGARLHKSSKTGRERIQAINVLDRAVRENPNDIELRQRLVELAMEPGFDSECNPDPHLQFLIDKQPKSAVPCEQLASRMDAVGDFSKAETLLKEGMRREENRASTRIRLARLLHFRLKREDDAKKLLSDFSTEGPAAKGKFDITALSAADRLALAGFYRDIGEQSKSRRIVGEALKAYPDDPDVLLAAAQDLDDQAGTAAEKDRDGILNEALNILKKCQSVAPAREECYVRLSYLFAKLQRHQEAHDILEKGLNVMPSSFDLRWAKSELLLAKNDDVDAQNEAGRVIEEIRSLDPRPELIQFLEARLNFSRRKWIDAAYGLEKAIPSLSRIPAATRRGLMMLGTAYHEIGEPVMRESAYRRLLVSEPLNVEACLGLGETLADQKRYSEAVEHLGRIALQTFKSEDKARLQCTLLISLVGCELEKELSRRKWEAVDQLLDEIEKAGKEANQLQWLRLVAEVRAGRLSADERFDDGLRAVDQFITLAPTLKETSDVTAETRRLALASAYRNKVQLLLLKKSDSKARQVLAEAKSKTGDTVALRLAEAQIECSAGRQKNQDALVKLATGEEAFQMRDRVLLLRSLAAISQQVGDEKGALLLCRRASIISPQDQSLQRARFLLALDLADLVQAKEAAAALAASYSTPGSPAACAQALLALNGIEGNPSANELRKQAVNLQGSEAHYPSWVGVPRALGRIADLEGRSKDAIKHYQAAFDAKAPSRRIARRLLQLNDQVQDYAEARKWIRFAEIDQSEPGLARIAAEVAVRAGDFESARRLVALAAPLDTSSADLAIWGGILLQAAKASADAEKMLRRAVEIAPGQPRPLAALVEMLVRQNRKGDARRELDAAYKTVPPASIPLFKARGEEAIGDLDAANRTLEESVKASNPGVPILRFAMEYYLRHLDLSKALNVASRLQKDSAASPADRAWAARMKGIALIASGKTDEARRSLSEIGVVDTGASEGDFRYDVRARAMILALQPSTRCWRDALAELKKLAQLNAEEPSDQLIAAQLQANLGEWGAAKVRLLALMQKLKKDDPRVLGSLVRGMLTNNESVAEIEPWLSRLERASPSDVDTMMLRAQWRDKKDHSAAAYVAELTRTGRADDFAAGMILADLNDSTAVTYLSRAAGDLSKARTPKQIAAGLQVARLQARFGKTRDALATCDSLKVNLSPTVYAQAYLGVLFATADDPPKEQITAFRDWLNQRINESPKQFSYRLAAAGLESRLGRQSEAISLLTTLKSAMLPTDPAYPAVINNLAFLKALSEKNSGDAERLLAERLSVSPTELELRDTLGLVQMEHGKLDQALAEFNELALLMPKGVVYYHLAQAQALKGDAKSAQTSFDKAKSLKFRPEELHQLERPQYERLLTKLTKNSTE
jgi:cellulose synthase operon protein C